jgi:hypothetical protein
MPAMAAPMTVSIMRFMPVDCAERHPRQSRQQQWPRPQAAGRLTWLGVAPHLTGGAEFAPVAAGRNTECVRSRRTPVLIRREPSC